MTNTGQKAAIHRTEASGKIRGTVKLRRYCMSGLLTRQVNWFWTESKLKSARLKVRHRRSQRDLYGCVTPAKATKSATVKFPGVDEGSIGVNPPATFR